MCPGTPFAWAGVEQGWHQPSRAGLRVGGAVGGIAGTGTAKPSLTCAREVT